MTINVTPARLYKLVQIALLVAIFGLLLWSQPWDGNTVQETRKISVTGEATIEAEPDEFIFYPYFEKTGTDRDAIRDELTEQANKVVDALKELGIEESKIKLNASSYDYWYWRKGEQGNMNIMITITLDNRDKAQEVQDYLLTQDNLKGQISPQATFSKDKQKELEQEATTKATEDAKTKADQQATLLGAEVGKVITVGQQSGYDFPVAYSGRAETLELDVAESAPSLPVLPGENEYSLSITVTYELR